MDIKLQVEKILKEQGITAPAMSQEEFIRRLNEKLATAIPERFIETGRNAASEIVAEEMKRLGREKLCKFSQNQKCTKGLDTSQCLECLSYVPKREWGKWLNNLYYRAAPERWEWGVIGVGTLAFVLAIVAPELRLWMIIFWFAMFIMSRFQVILQWKLVRVLNRGTLKWLK